MFRIRHRPTGAAILAVAGILVLPAPSRAGSYRHTRSYAASVTLPGMASSPSSAPGIVQSAGSADTGVGWYESKSPKREFEKKTGYPNGRPGYVVDYIVPLGKGGADTIQNMQWLTIEQARARAGVR